MTEEERLKKLEELGKQYSQACNNAILTEYLGKSHPIFDKTSN